MMIKILQNKIEERN